MACLQVLIDWGNDLSYAASGADVSDRVMADAGLTISRGKDQILAYAPPLAGECRFVLWNFSRDYSPGNMSSPLYPNVKPPKRLQVILSGSTGEDLLFEEGDTILFEEGDTFEDEDTPDQPLWTGIADDFRQFPNIEDQAVEVSALGMFSRLRGKNVTTPLYQNIRTDQALGYLLDAAGWPALDRDLDIGNVTLDWWWADAGTGDAFTAASRIALSEGVGASWYENPDGYAVFENNAARETQIRSVVSQATYDNTINTSGDEYLANYQNTIIACRIIQQEREAQPSDVIWTYGGSLVLGNNESIDLIVRSGSDPFMNAQIPTAFGTNEVQVITPIVTLTSGSFTITWNGQTTAAINYNDTATEIQTAMEGLSNIDVGDVYCWGGPINTAAVYVMFTGLLKEAEQELMTITSQLNSTSLPTTLDVIRTDNGAGEYYDTLVPRDTPITGGSFKLRQGSTTTGVNLFSASAANIQTAWENTSQYDPGDLSSSGGPIASASVTLTYTDGLAFPPSPTTVVESSLVASRYATNVLTVSRSVKGGGPDYVIVSGGLAAAGMSINRNNGGSLTLTIPAGASGLTLTGLQLRAQLVSVVRRNEVTYPDVAADAEGQIFSPDVVPEIALAVQQANAQSWFERYENPRPVVLLQFDIGMGATEVDELLRREVSDLVTIVDSQTGINETYFVEFIRHTQNGYKMFTEFGCEKAI